MNSYNVHPWSSPCWLGLHQASRSYTHYGSQKEYQDWRVHNFEERRHRHPPPKPYFPFVKLPSFNGDIDPNVYLGWDDKVEQIFNVYEV